jgi:hypothetical protein
MHLGAGNSTTPAVQFNGSAPVNSLVIDSSGRLLVGTSSGTTQVAAKFQARAGTPVAQGTIMLSRGTANPANAQTIGEILFTDSNESRGAKINAVPEANWATNDYPTRLGFFTTAAGASGPTERMRIKNDGTINFSNVAVYADNAAAKTGGLVDGDVYRTSTGDLKIVYT